MRISRVLAVCLLASNPNTALAEVFIAPRKQVARSGPRNLLLYDCQPEFLDSVQGWSAEKRAFCCTRNGFLCKMTAEKESGSVSVNNGYDCNDGSETEWLVGKKLWCCEHTGQGCPNNYYDCDADLPDWQRSWSVAKRAYCCQNHLGGCEAPGLSEALIDGKFDCKAAQKNWEKEWSDKKKRACGGTLQVAV